MTIESEITRIKTNIENAYTKAEEKGASMPEVLNSDSLAGCIESIPQGGGSGDGEDLIENIPEGKYRVRFFDYDGTLLDRQLLNLGDTIVYPEVPNHEKLNFYGWLDKKDTVSYHYDTTALYTPENDKTWLKIEVNEDLGMTLYAKAYQNSGQITVDGVRAWYNDYSDIESLHPSYRNVTLTIDYGDGTIVNKSLAGTVNGNTNFPTWTSGGYNFKPHDFIDFSHTYTKSGTYYVSLSTEVDGMGWSLLLGETSGSKLYLEDINCLFTTGSATVSKADYDIYSDLEYINCCANLKEIYFSEQHLGDAHRLSTLTNNTYYSDYLIGYTPNLVAVAGQRHITSNNIQFPLDGYFEKTNGDANGVLPEARNYSPCVCFSNIEHILSKTHTDFASFKNAKSFNISSSSGYHYLYNFDFKEIIFDDGLKKLCVYNSNALKNIYHNSSSDFELELLVCPNLCLNNLLPYARTLGIGPALQDVTTTATTTSITGAGSYFSYSNSRTGNRPSNMYQLNAKDANITSMSGTFSVKNNIYGELILPTSLTSVPYNFLSDMIYVTVLNLENLTNMETINLSLSGCFNLRKIKLPKGANVTLGNSYFKDVRFLKDISFLQENNITATSLNYLFSQCYSLNNLDLTVLDNTANSITSMQKMCEKCSNLREVTFPNKTLGITSKSNLGYLFNECTNLKSVNNLGSLNFIGDYMFYNCRSLESIDIQSPITEIGSQAFYGCSKLKTVTLPDSLITINSSAFNQCSALQDIELPNSLTTIKSGIFNGCTSLQKLTIPDSVTSLNDNQNGLFPGCSSLEKVWIPSTVTKISASNYPYSPFRDTNPDIIIYTDVTEKPSGWDKWWNYLNQSTQAKVYWGATKENYENGDPVPETTA